MNGQLMCVRWTIARFLLVLLATTLFIIAGCSRVLSSVTPAVSYTAPKSGSAVKSKAILLYSIDERRSKAVSKNAGVGGTLLGHVTAHVNNETESLVSPLRITELAAQAKLQSMGFTVHLDSKTAPENAIPVLISLYAFDVDFTTKNFGHATVATSFGKAVQVAKTPEGSTPSFIPCTRSVGMGAAMVGAQGTKAAADIALSEALTRSINALTLEGCLR